MNLNKCPKCKFYSFFPGDYCEQCFHKIKRKEFSSKKWFTADMINIYKKNNSA